MGGSMAWSLECSRMAAARISSINGVPHLIPSRGRGRLRRRRRRRRDHPPRQKPRSSSAGTRRPPHGQAVRSGSDSRGRHRVGRRRHWEQRRAMRAPWCSSAGWNTIDSKFTRLDRWQRWRAMRVARGGESWSY
jgi:hypothetical protein